MASVKTAISINQALFEEVNRVADELKVSRSSLFVLAVEEFIQRYEGQRLLEEINQAYNDLPSPEEAHLQQGMRLHHRQVVEGEW